MKRLCLALTYGDPEGIGVEIIRKLCSEGILGELPCEFLLFGESAILGLVDPPTNFGFRPIEDHHRIPDPGQHSFQYLNEAIRSCLRGECQGLITGPISKERWQGAGLPWSGQTELLGHLTGTSPEMLFMTSDPAWRVLLITRHIPLREVSEAINFTRLQEASESLRLFLRKYAGIISPRIALAGLNPHAGDGGACGREEIEHWQGWCQELGIEGPFSPDLLWVQSGRAYLGGKAQPFDACLAPYHDQILPLIKLTTKFRAVNVSIGLPFVRTSPDHGTAFDLVGTGQADSGAMLEAIQLCLKLSSQTC